MKFTYTNKVDVWALGCLIYEMIFREKAFENDFLVHRYLEKGEFETARTSTILDEVHLESTMVIVRKMLHPAPEGRPSAKEALLEFNLCYLAMSKCSNLPETFVLPSDLKFPFGGDQSENDVHNNQTSSLTVSHSVHT